jgi:ATP-dependent Clp protease ATP-binding subunit ClpA
LSNFKKVKQKVEKKMLRDEVVADDIAAVVAVWTGIPAQRPLTTA